MERMVIGRLKGPPEGVPIGTAKPIPNEPGQVGGAPEVVVPNPETNIEIESDIPLEIDVIP